MVNACCVINCYNRSQDRRGKRIANGVRFYSFPAWKQHLGDQISDLTKRRRMAWIAAIRRKDITFDNISRHMFVCSRHFLSGKPAYEMLECHPDWVPSLHLGHTEEIPLEELNRRSKRPLDISWNSATPAKPLPLTGIKSETEESSPSLQIDECAPLEDVSEGLQMDESASQDCTEEQPQCCLCSRRREEIQRLLEENRRLKEELSKRKINEDFLKDDDEKVEYYTGLPCFTVLTGLLTQLLPCLSRTGCKLSPFQMFLLTLMRLRLNLPIQHTAHLFCVDQKTVTTMFRDTINAMFTNLKPLVQWPKRQCLQGSMPPPFVEAFGSRIAVIVDCFEIIAEETDQKSIAQTSSHNKHKLKYLIGITPRGAIALISKGLGGGVSDKDAIESSGLLDKLLPKDLVLMDHGFDVNENVELMCAEVKMQKLVPKDEEETRKMAHLRVHMKRVIGCVRAKYTMLSETVPVSMVDPCEGEDMILLDKIVTVCCALTNMCPSVMKL